MVAQLAMERAVLGISLRDEICTKTKISLLKKSSNQLVGSRYYLFHQKYGVYLLYILHARFCMLKTSLKWHPSVHWALARLTRRLPQICPNSGNIVIVFLWLFKRGVLARFKLRALHSLAPVECGNIVIWLLRPCWAPVHCEVQPIHWHFIT